VTEQKRAEAALSSLSRKLMGAQDDERALVARELHDHVGQQVAILSMELHSLGSGGRNVDSATWLSRAIETVHGIADSLHDLSHRLHPARLQLAGLVSALDDLRRDFSRSHPSVAFAHRDVPTVIEHDIALCVFRVAQESLRNAVRHSGAENVRIELAGVTGWITLSVADDGRGFDITSPTSDGLGLVSMRERVKSVGGVLEIHSTRGSGTRVMVAVPTRVEPFTASNASASA
jgi:signal transduction histidine kinase